MVPSIVLMANPRSAASGSRQLVLGSRVEVVGGVALVKLFGWIAPSAIDHSPPLDCWATHQLFPPTRHMAIGRHVQELSGII